MDGTKLARLRRVSKRHRSCALDPYYDMDDPEPSDDDDDDYDENAVILYDSGSYAGRLD